MKLTQVYHTQINISPIKERWYVVTDPTHILLRTDSGCIHILVQDGFKFDGRSGGKIVDWISPNIGTQAETCAYLVHDINFYGFGLSFETTNSLLKQQLILDAKYGNVRASLIKWGVDTAFARKSFESNTPAEIENKKLIKWEWIDDKRGLMIAQAIIFSNDKTALNDLSNSSIAFRRHWDDT